MQKLLPNVSVNIFVFLNDIRLLVIWKKNIACMKIRMYHKGLILFVSVPYIHESLELILKVHKRCRNFRS